MKKQNKAYLFALAAVLCWSTVGTVFKLTLQFLDNFNMLLWAVPFAIFIVSIFLFFEKQKFKLLTFKEFLFSAIGGFLNPFFYYLILFKAYDLLVAQEALTLNYLWPVVLVLLSIPILKQKINFIGIFALLISFFGSLFIATHGNVFSLSFSNSYGVFLAILSTFIWAAFWLLNLFDKRNESTKLFYNFSFGIIYLIIYGIITQKIKIPEFYGLAGAAYIGIFEMGLTFFLWLKALSLSSNTAKVSNLIFISPFISLIIISLVLKEAITYSTVIGLILIISGILIQRFYGSQKECVTKNVG